jgi:DNA replication protein DnaC
MDNALIIKKLRRLKMPGIAETLEHRLSEAMKEKWSYKQLTLRLAKSRMDQNKTMETFDFTFNSKVQAPLVRELSLCAFMEKKENIFILGPSGVGKSHLAQAIGHEACRREYDTLFYCTYQLFEWIYAGRGDGTHKRRLAQAIKTPLLILDDFALQDLNEAQQTDLYQLIAGRYEKSSTIITSNRDFDEWQSVFTNPLLGSAALDRLVHKGIQIVIEGSSYRLEEFKKTCAKIKKNKQ